MTTAETQTTVYGESRRREAQKRFAEQARVKRIRKEADPQALICDLCGIDLQRPATLCGFCCNELDVAEGLPETYQPNAVDDATRQTMEAGERELAAKLQKLATKSSGRKASVSRYEQARIDQGHKPQISHSTRNLDGEGDSYYSAVDPDDIYAQRRLARARSAAGHDVELPVIPE